MSQLQVNIKTEQQFSRWWIAIDAETYDGPGSPIGCGPTELAAISDLFDQLLDRQEVTA